MSYYKDIATAEINAYLYALETVALLTASDYAIIEESYWDAIDDGDTPKQAFESCALISIEHDW